LESLERLGAAGEPLLALAPVGLMFASLVPWCLLARALARALDIPDDAPVIDQHFGLVWFVVAVATGLVMMLIGYSLGVVLNVLIARFAFGWPMAAIVEAGIGPTFVSVLLPHAPEPRGHDPDALS
jgi:hypothetical protein